MNDKLPKRYTMDHLGSYVRTLCIYHVYNVAHYYKINQIKKIVQPWTSTAAFSFSRDIT